MKSSCREAGGEGRDTRAQARTGTQCGSWVKIDTHDSCKGSPIHRRLHATPKFPQKTESQKKITAREAVPSGEWWCSWKKWFIYCVFTKDTLDEKGHARDTRVHVTL